jgi:pantetheine-phosphate adenylyltransferase
MALVNRKLNKSVETVFLMPSEEYSYLTSTLIKEVASFGGRLTDFLHPQVAQRLLQRLGKRKA